MARSENQKLKLFRLLEILTEKTDETHGLSMTEIISCLERLGIKAERKSVYDDLALLDELGFSVEKLPTRPTKYTLTGRVFELAELKLLVDAVQSSKFITVENSRRLIDKLKTFAGEYGAVELSRQVYIEGRGKTDNKSTIYSIDTIHTAINSSKQIKFRYFRYDSNKERVYGHGGEYYFVSPISLIWREENYYLVAYDKASGEVRNYRVDRMQNAEVLAEDSDPKASEHRLDSAEYSKKIFGMFGGEEVGVTLECSEDMANNIIDRFGSEIPFIKGDGSFRVNVRVIVSPVFYAWVMGFGSKIKIISPEGVRSEFLRELRATIDNYNE